MYSIYIMSNGLELAAGLSINFAPGNGRINQTGWSLGNSTLANTSNILGPSYIRAVYNAFNYLLFSVSETSSGVTRNMDMFMNVGGGGYGNLSQAGDSMMYFSHPAIIQSKPLATNNYKCGIRMDGNGSGRVGMYAKEAELVAHGETGNIVVKGTGNSTGLVISNKFLWDSGIADSGNGAGYNLGWILRTHNDMGFVIIPTVNNKNSSGDWENTAKGCYIYPTSGAWTFYSDGRLKKDITYFDNVLNKILQLKPCTFKWKNEDTSTPLHYGFIAQDVQEIFPEFVSVCDKESKEKYMGVSTGDLIPVLTQGIKDQHAIIMEQQKQIDSLQSQVETLQSQLQSIMKHLNIHL